ncbi:hypothetical protein DERF_003149 [Dermatophagoides farinae]|uniref:CBM21 domain-containing protein n=1 Tax=Dermatophagoides farinae TaxID=6954 RepID=A0A922LCE1_DERFA|nr:hypothetical protein DERF_003149 [Dermatophagoides farinae]
MNDSSSTLIVDPQSTALSSSSPSFSNNQKMENISSTLEQPSLSTIDGELSSPIFSMSPALLMFSSQDICNDYSNTANSISSMIDNSGRNKKFSFSSSTSVSDSGTESIVDEDFAREKILNYFVQDNSKTVRLARRRMTGICHSTPLKSRDNLVDDDDEKEEFSPSDSDHESESTLSNCKSPSSSYSLSPVDNFDGTPRSNDTILDLNTVCVALNKKLREEKEKHDNHDSKRSDIINDGSLDDITAEEIHDNNQNDRRNSTLVRSTSLKTGKTPPGTPGSKKIVRFADAMGLDLASIRHIVDDVPYMPPLAAFKSLQLDDEDRDWLLQNRSIHPPTFNMNNRPIAKTDEMLATMRMLFPQPISDPVHFMERVRTNKICLENCLLSGPTGSNHIFTINCIVRVLNVCFQKQVILRYTTNEWLTWTEIPGTYVPNSNDGFSDKFSVNFELAVNSNGHQTMMPGQRLMFAIRYLTENLTEFWDNNVGMNYSFIYQRC